VSERGFTLVELMAAVALAAVLLSLALPSFQRLLAAQRAAAAVNQMVGAVNLARALAITTGRIVTLCPGSGGVCLGRNQWHLGALVFLDRDGNGRLDGDERVARGLPPLAPGERLYWRSFRNRSYLQFHPRGYTQWQNGNFLYCPPDNDPRHARMLVINAAGRVRPARDADGDGIAEDAGGDPVQCP
jgi:type IV fimbrial biogenesis protein FimT